MRRFRESLILKVIALVLVATFASQQVCFAEKTDLREEGEITALNVILAIVSGVLSGLAVNPSWSAMQTFAMSYLVPRGASLLCDAANIKNPYIRAAIECGISAGVGGAIDTSVANKGAEAANKGAEAAANGTATTAATLSTKITEAGGTAAQAGTAASRLTSSAASSIKGFISKINIFSKAADTGLRAVNGASASLFTVALIKGAQGAIYGVARTYLYENIQKYDKHLAIFVSSIGGAVVSEFAMVGMSKAFGIAFGYDKYGAYAIKPAGGTLGLNRQLNLQLLSYIKRELPAQLVASGVETGLAEVGMSEEGVHGISGLVGGLVSGFLGRNKFVKEYEGKSFKELAEAKDVIEGELTRDTEAIEKGTGKPLTLNKYEEYHARLQAINAIMLLRKYQGDLDVASHKSKTEAKELIDLRAKAYDAKNQQAEQNLRNSGVIVQGLTPEQQARKAQLETGLVPLEENGRVIGGAPTKEKVDTSNGQDANMIKLTRAFVSYQQGQINELKGGFTTILINAAISGATSATLQYISSKTPSALHGAVFNLFAGSLLKAFFIKNAMLFKRTEDGEIVAVSKGLGFYAAILGSSADEAVADVISMGRAKANMNSKGGFDLDWIPGQSDAPYLERLYDYIQDMDKYGLGTALMNQFVTSMHYQAVRDVTNTITGKIQRPYLRDDKRPQIPTTLGRIPSVPEAAEAADNARPVTDLPKGSEVYQVIGYDDFGNEIGREGTVKENKNGVVTVEWKGGGVTTLSGGTIGEVFDDVKFKGSYASLGKLRSNLNPLRSPFSGLEQLETRLLDKQASGEALTPEEQQLLFSEGVALIPYRQAQKAWNAPGHRGLWVAMDSYINEADLNNPDLKSLPEAQKARQEKLEELANAYMGSKSAEIRKELQTKMYALLAPSIDKLRGSLPPAEAAKLDQQQDEKKYAALNQLEEQQFANPGAADRPLPNIDQKLADIEDERINLYRKAAPAAARQEYDQTAGKIKKQVTEEINAKYDKEAQNQAKAILGKLHTDSVIGYHDIAGISQKLLSNWQVKPGEFAALKQLVQQLNLQLRMLDQEMRLLVLQLRLQKMDDKLRQTQEKINMSNPGLFEEKPLPKGEPKGREEGIKFPKVTVERVSTAKPPELPPVAVPATLPAAAVASPVRVAQGQGAVQQIDFSSVLPPIDNPGNPVILVNPQTGKDIRVSDMNPNAPRPVPEGKVEIIPGNGQPGFLVDASLFPQAESAQAPAVVPVRPSVAKAKAGAAETPDVSVKINPATGEITLMSTPDTKAALSARAPAVARARPAPTESGTPTPDVQFDSEGNPSINLQAAVQELRRKYLPNDKPKPATPPVFYLPDSSNGDSTPATVTPKPATAAGPAQVPATTGQPALRPGADVSVPLPASATLTPAIERTPASVTPGIPITTENPTISSPTSEEHPQVLTETDRLLRDSQVLRDKMEKYGALRSEYDKLSKQLADLNYLDTSRTLMPQMQKLQAQMNEIYPVSPAPTPATVTPKPVTVAGSTRLPSTTDNTNGLPGQSPQPTDTTPLARSESKPTSSGEIPVPPPASVTPPASGEKFPSGKFQDPPKLPPPAATLSKPALAPTPATVTPKSVTAVGSAQLPATGDSTLRSGADAEDSSLIRTRGVSVPEIRQSASESSAAPLVLQPPALTTPATTEKPKSDFDDLLARSQQVLQKSEDTERQTQIILEKSARYQSLLNEYNKLSKQLADLNYLDTSRTLMPQMQKLQAQMNE
ncbi:MAG: hypothetical protein NT033_07505, partial [Candidatus Omnitrophica bacterium]|nr:hypothetical protein [Candidatus Omnitrophota bacterium]